MTGKINEFKFEEARRNRMKIVCRTDG